MSLMSGDWRRLATTGDVIDREIIIEIKWEGNDGARAGRGRGGRLTGTRTRNRMEIEKWVERVYSPAGRFATA